MNEIETTADLCIRVRGWRLVPDGISQEEANRAFEQYLKWKIENELEGLIVAFL